MGCLCSKAIDETLIPQSAPRIIVNANYIFQSDQLCRTIKHSGWATRCCEVLNQEGFAFMKIEHTRGTAITKSITKVLAMDDNLLASATRKGSGLIYTICNSQNQIVGKLKLVRQGGRVYAADGTEVFHAKMVGCGFSNTRSTLLFDPAEEVVAKWVWKSGELVDLRIAKGMDSVLVAVLARLS